MPAAGGFRQSQAIPTENAGNAGRLCLSWCILAKWYLITWPICGMITPDGNACVWHWFH